MRALSVGFVFVLVACGSSPSSPSPSSDSSPTAPAGSPCEAAGTAMCERACSCSTDANCHVGLPGDDLMARYDFADLQGCLDFYVVFACSTGGEPGFDYARCEAKNRSAACSTVGDVGTFPMPSECEIP